MFSGTKKLQQTYPPILCVMHHPLYDFFINIFRIFHVFWNKEITANLPTNTVRNAPSSL